MTTWDDRTLIQDLVAHGVDDWVDAAWVRQIASRTGIADPSALRALALGLVAEAIMAGLMVPGDVDEAGFRPWESPPGAGLARVVEQWLDWGVGPPTPGAVCWLNVTPRGEALGRQVLGGERQ